MLGLNERVFIADAVRVRTRDVREFVRSGFVSSALRTAAKLYSRVGYTCLFPVACTGRWDDASTDSLWQCWRGSQGLAGSLDGLSVLGTGLASCNLGDEPYSEMKRVGPVFRLGWVRVARASRGVALFHLMLFFLCSS